MEDLIKEFGKDGSPRETNDNKDMQTGAVEEATEFKEPETVPGAEISKPHVNISTQQHDDHNSENKSTLIDDDWMDVDEELFGPNEEKRVDQSLDKTTKAKPDAQPNPILPAQVLPSSSTSISQEYNPEPKWHSERRIQSGYVVWWCKLLGRGQIVENKTSIVHSIGWRDIVPYNYGSLVNGILVRYQLSRYGGIGLFWVPQGMPSIMLDEALDSDSEFPYLADVRRDRYPY